MAVTAFWYGKGLQSLVEKKIDYINDSIKVMLCTSTYSPNQDTHQYKSDVTNEVSGTGYTATGTALTTKTDAYTSGTNTIALDADDVTWSSSSITARYAVIYDATPASDATRPLLGYVDFGADVTSTNGNFTITWAAGGILTATAS